MNNDDDDDDDNNNNNNNYNMEEWRRQSNEETQKDYVRCLQNHMNTIVTTAMWESSITTRKVVTQHSFHGWGRAEFSGVSLQRIWW